MNNRVKLTLLDEVNVRFDNLPQRDITYLQDKTKLYVKGYFSTVRYKKRLWDGKESQVANDGGTFFYMLDKITSLLEQRGFNIEQDIDVVDQRPNLHSVVPKIDENFLSAYGITLNYYQVESANEIIDHLKGIIEVGTSGGKTFIASTVAKVFDSLYRTIVIVPNDNLGKAMVEMFEKIGLDVVFINRNVTGTKREQAWNKHRHVIITYQTLKNNMEHLKDFHSLVYDEVHIMGDVMFSMLMKELAHCIVRIGMTGTVPVDKQKREKIMCRIGGDILYNIETHTLAEKGFIAKAKIHMVKLKHEKKEIDDWLKKKTLTELPWSWEIEERYLHTSKKRVDAICKLIMTLTTENTLILCEPELGVRLAQVTGLPYIDGDTNPDARLIMYKMFESRKDVKLIASYGTVGTGISINDIFNGILIDPGKDYTKILQGIGRMLRLDSLNRNTVDIWDVYSDLHYSMKHRTKRLSIYKEKKFEHNPDAMTIEIGE